MHSDEQAALLHSTMARTMEADLFDEKRFSDLTVKLANGVAINVHKIVLCRKNEYFNSLCGPDSRFAESNQSTIELKDDNPSALEGLIRWLYTLPVVVRHHEPWAFWLVVRITADKYLAPDLSKKAFENFWYATLEIKTAENIFEILETIERDMSHDAMLVEAAGRLRRRWLHSLLKLPAFRARMVDDTDLMLDLLEHLSGKLASRGTEDPFMTPKRGEQRGLPNRMKTFLCDDHKKAVFYPVNDLERGGAGRCSYCSVLRGVVGLPLIEGTYVTLADKSWPPHELHAEMRSA